MIIMSALTALRKLSISNPSAKPCRVESPSWLSHCVYVGSRAAQRSMHVAEPRAGRAGPGRAEVEHGRVNRWQSQTKADSCARLDVCQRQTHTGTNNKKATLLTPASAPHKR